MTMLVMLEYIFATVVCSVMGEIKCLSPFVSSVTGDKCLYTDVE